MISIAIVKAKGEMVHPAIMPTSSGCQLVVKPDVVRQNCLHIHDIKICENITT